jgi:hypothetical protein
MQHADPESTKVVIPGEAERRPEIHEIRHSGRSSAETRNPGSTINWIPAFAGMTPIFILKRVRFLTCAGMTGGAMRKPEIHEIRHSGRSSAETRNPASMLN